MIRFPVEETKLGAQLGADVEKSRLPGSRKPPLLRCRAVGGVGIRFKPSYRKEIGLAVPVPVVIPPFLLEGFCWVYWLFVNC